MSDLNPTIIPTITPDQAGRWFEGASHRTADELSADVILCALSYGWQPDDVEALRELAGTTVGWRKDTDDSETLNYASQDAVVYLNDLTPAGYLFAFDNDGLDLLAVCQLDWLDWDLNPCPHGRECPNIPPTWVCDECGHHTVDRYGTPTVCGSCASTHIARRWPAEAV